MKNAAALLLAGVLGLLLATEGAADVKCYMCPDCVTVSATVKTQDCDKSCYASVTCNEGGGVESVKRSCSNTKKKNTFKPDEHAPNTFNAFCNDNNCDVVQMYPKMCGGSGSSATTSLAPLVLLLAAFQHFVLA